MLSTQILALAKAEPWMIAQRFIDVLSEVDPQMVKFELKELVNRKKLISCSGHFGVEYALPGELKQGQPRPEYQWNDPKRPAQTRLAKAPVSDAAERAPVPAAAPAKPPLNSGLRASTAIPETIPERKPHPIEDLQLRIREALLAGALDFTPRSLVALQSALLTKVEASTSAIRRVADHLVTEGIAERRASGKWLRYARKTTATPGPALAPADEPTMSDTAPAKATNNNRGSVATETPPCLSAKPDGAAHSSLGCAEHPADDEGKSSIEKLTEALKLGAPVTEADVIEPQGPSTGFALWSGGTLEMRFSTRKVVLAPDETKALFDYLDVIDYRAIEGGA